MPSIQSTSHAGRLAVAALALGAGHARAQEAAAAAPEPEAVRLEEFIVRESAVTSGTVLPTSRPVDSVFGSQSVLEAPRAVTIITPELLRQFDIQDFGDLARLGAGTQQINYYGVPGIPTLRGAKGSVYFNGMQRAFNRNEMPLSFGSIEGMDLVKGPAPAHFGAALVGGYVNLLPKSPYFDMQRGSMQIEIGQYDSYRMQADVGGPVLLGDIPAAYRVSLTAQLADSYYDRVGNDFISLYASMKAELAPGVTLFTGAEFYNYKSNENAGWNRPTQELLDSGRYVVGEPISVADSRWGGNANRDLIYGGTGFKYGPPIPSSSVALVVPPSYVTAALSAGTVTPAQVALMNDLSTTSGRAAAYADIPSSALPFIAQTSSGFQYTPAYIAAGGPVFTTTIDGSTVLTDDSDFADSQNLFWFADLVFSGNPDRRLRNQTIIDYISTTKLSSYGYAFDSEQLVIENKTSITEEIEAISTTITYGVSGRFTTAWQLQDFWDEPFSRRDISSPTISGNSRVFSGGVAPDGSGRVYWNGGFGGVGGNIESDLFQGSVFAYGHTVFTDFLHAYTSVLGAYSFFEVGSPAEWGSRPSDEHDFAYYSVSFSPQIRITPQLIIYATGQIGTAADPLQGGPINGRSSFAENTLAEVGVKASLLDETLFASFAGYSWAQGSFNTRQAVSEELQGQGLEFELTWTATEQLTFIAAAGVQRVTLEGSGTSFRAIPMTEEEWALWGGVLNDPFDAINTGGPFGSPPNNPDRILGSTPESQVKLFAAYDFESGFGISGGAVWSAAYWHNYDRTLRIPSTIVANAAVYYRQETWDVSLSVENLTDEDYFPGSDPVFGSSTIITKGPERNFKATLTYRF